MSTLHDLRSTLDQHAEGLHDTEQYVRPVAVRARITAVRRRRAAAVSATAVLVLVAGVATAVGLRSPDALEPASVVGVDVPRDLTVSGFPYSLADTEELDGAERLKLEKSDEWRAVTLVARGLGSGSATLYSNGEAVARVRGDERSAAPVWVGDEGTALRVRLDGAAEGAQTGLAVYEATGQLAPGVANADRTSVFRDTVAGSPLIAAAFAEPGSDDLDLEVTGDVRQMRFVFQCVAADDVYVNMTVDGKDYSASSCGDRSRDAGAGSSVTYEQEAPGRDHLIHVFLTQGPDGEPVEDLTKIEFGLGIYELPDGERDVLGNQVSSRVEYQGRTFVLDEVVDAPATIDTSSGDVLLGFAATGADAVSASWTSELLGDEFGSVSLGDGGSTSSAGLLLAGDTYDVRLKGGVTEGALLVYRPLPPSVATASGAQEAR